MFSKSRVMRHGRAVVVLALLAAACGGPEGRAGGTPNLVLVSLDTLRADHLGVYGHAAPTTPAIDRFARDAVTFRRFVSHCPSTLPSHASLLTSVLPHHHGASVVEGTMVSPSLPTLAEELSRAGYATASFNGGLQMHASFGLGRGFDVYESARGRTAGAEVLVGPEITLAHAVRAGLEWIARADRPFFLFLHSYEVHDPYTPDPRDLRVFERDGDYGGSLPDEISRDLIKRINRGERVIDREDLRHIVAAYDAELRSADRAFAELIASLREDDLYDDTMIVFVSDHGEEFGEHGQVGRHSHTLFDELLLVPALVKYPGSAHAGRIVSEPVRGIDLAPTTLAALELEPPPEFSGRDLEALVAGDRIESLPAVSRRDKSANADSVSIRLDSWKLYNADLFDLARDPRERIDTSASFPGVVERLAERHRSIVDGCAPAPTVPAGTPSEVVERLRAVGYLD